MASSLPVMLTRKVTWKHHRLSEEIDMNENLFEAVLMVALVVITLLFLKFAS
jgi:hypothetical protein